MTKTTLTFDCETGELVGDFNPISGQVGNKIASLVLPGTTPELIDKLYGDWMSNDPGSSMGDVMKAIQDAEAAAVLHGEVLPGWPKVYAHSAVRDKRYDAYEPMRDHIGELHAAIARLQGAMEQDPHATIDYPGHAFEDLFALLPGDWAGEQ